MPEGVESAGDPVKALADEWRELMNLHVHGELSDDDFKRNAHDVHGRIYEFINNPKTKEAGEKLLEKVYGDVGQELFNEGGEE